MNDRWGFEVPVRNKEERCDTEVEDAALR